MAGVLPARLAAGALPCLLPSPQQRLQCGGQATWPLAAVPPLASTSQTSWGNCSSASPWQPVKHRYRSASIHDRPKASCSSSISETSFIHSGHRSFCGSGIESLSLVGAALSYTERDVRRRGTVQCAAGKKVAKRKGGAGGAGGRGGAGPRESPAILLRRSSELYEALMRPELIEEGLVREYVVCARLILGEDPLTEAVRNLDLLHDWLPVAELAFASAQEDNVAQMLPLMKREICECVLRAVPQAKNVPRTMLEYAYEKRESFVKHVLENVDAIGREAPSSGEADPFAVLGLSRGASAQQVRTAYRAMAAIYHPDRNPAPDAAAKYMQVTKAYEELKAGGGTAGAGFSAYASIGGRERDDLHGPIDMSKSVKQVGEGKEIAVRALDSDVVAKFTARAHSVALKRSAMADRTRRAQAVPA